MSESSTERIKPVASPALDGPPREMGFDQSDLPPELANTEPTDEPTAETAAGVSADD